ncbi:glutathione S-transferase family protein [Caballeronia sp. LZ008]|uniref:glutathione S-transferase family protein n=1 Tax=unclassified Caballeronia TaxID=2646786 RepID=UPI00202949E0|nr:MULTISPECIES: glutathione S-transferase family protein [unclassified Caballeronia]MDR5796430.1 glutathione S-transferase family protein [Caballeronia sp. LZ008]
MITLYSYPQLFGLEDNNPFGLKVFAFLKLAALPFEHRHVLDTSAAPRGQLPYLVDGDETIGDSDAIIAHLKSKHAIELDDALGAAQRDLDLLVRRTLDDLYWVMSYSRWRDDRYWPQFRDALLTQHPNIGADALEGARKYNFERYRYQGIGRYEPDAVYARGIASLQAIANLLGDGPFMFGDAPASIDAALYGFVANIWFYDIDTPLKRFVATRGKLVEHCGAVRERMGQGAVA